LFSDTATIESVFGILDRSPYAFQKKPGSESEAPFSTCHPGKRDSSSLLGFFALPLVFLVVFSSWAVPRGGGSSVSGAALLPLAFFEGGFSIFISSLSSSSSDDDTSEGSSSFFTAFPFPFFSLFAAEAGAALPFFLTGAFLAGVGTEGEETAAISDFFLRRRRSLVGVVEACISAVAPASSLTPPPAVVPWP